RTRDRSTQDKTPPCSLEPDEVARQPQPSNLSPLRALGHLASNTIELFVRPASRLTFRTSQVYEGCTILYTGHCTHRPSEPSESVAELAPHLVDRIASSSQDHSLISRDWLQDLLHLPAGQENPSVRDRSTQGFRQHG